VARTQTVKVNPRRVVAKPTFTMRSLQRLAAWGATATAALFVAIIMSRSEVASQRVAVALSSLHLGSPSSERSGQGAAQVASQVAPRPLEADPATRQLVQTVRGLAADRDQLMTRLATLEHNLDDVTGSVARQIEAAKASTASASWPNDQPPVPATPGTIASVVAPVVPAPAGLASPPPSSSPIIAAADATPLAALPSEYGVDIGSALSIQALHARWAGIRSAHPQLFEGLKPVVTLKEIPRSKRVELRLMVGPFPSAEAAGQLCASLVAFRLPCQPTSFDGQHLALQ
jgi:hypothetical protein